MKKVCEKCSAGALLLTCASWNALLSGSQKVGMCSGKRSKGLLVGCCLLLWPLEERMRKHTTNITDRSTRTCCLFCIGVPHWSISERSAAATGTPRRVRPLPRPRQPPEAHGHRFVRPRAGGHGLIDLSIYLSIYLSALTFCVLLVVSCLARDSNPGWGD